MAKVTLLRFSPGLEPDLLELEVNKALFSVDIFVASTHMILRDAPAWDEAQLRGRKDSRAGAEALLLKKTEQAAAVMEVPSCTVLQRAHHQLGVLLAEIGTQPTIPVNHTLVKDRTLQSSPACHLLPELTSVGSLTASPWISTASNKAFGVEELLLKLHLSISCIIRSAGYGLCVAIRAVKLPSKEAISDCTFLIFW
ncbi:hypothetical protein U0070_011619 [Myodes glareolus]|uniref:Uncharacterized protein n=1 Tax=Myodes glareolus TaxID=447135 RepID=A0AAW0HIV8_MYOGA